MAGKAKKTGTHKWQFTKYFRAGAYGWKGTARASGRIKDAVKEIKTVAKKDPVTAAQGAVKFFEKCWCAIEHIDSSSGALGNAVSYAVIELSQVIHDAPLTTDERNKLLQRIWQTWQEEDYGFYEELGEKWVTLCAEHEIMTYWADALLPVVKRVFSSDTPGAYFKGSIPCLACLFETGRYNEIVEIVQSRPKPMFSYYTYLIKVVLARGDIEKALSMVDEYLSDYNESFQAAYFGEEILLNAGRTEEAYERYAFLRPFRMTGLATLSALRKRYPDISPERILNDLIDADPGNERRYFAAARKIGMVSLALEIAEKHNVEPKTLTTACKDYLEKDVELSLRFGCMALQRYADGYGYEPELPDVLRCYEFVCMAAERAGKRDEINRKLQQMAMNDKSKRKMVASVVHTQHPCNGGVSPV